MTTTKIYIADSQTMTRQALANVILTFNPLFKTTEAGDGSQLIQLVEKEIPDVVIIDLDSPAWNGYKVVARLLTAYPEVKVIALSCCDNQDQVVRTMQLGVWALISKSYALEELECALNVAASCGKYENTIMQKALRYHRAERASIVYTFRPTLSSRELSILELICKEHTNKQIGYALSLSEHTVRNHKVRIMRKVGVKNNSGLVKFALSLGYFADTTVTS